MLSRSFFSCDYSCEYMNTLVQCELGGSNGEKERLQGIRESSNKNKPCKLHETDESDWPRHGELHKRANIKFRH